MATVTIDPSVPQNTENEGLGASRIRNLAGWLNAMFGQSSTNPFTYSVNPFNVDGSGNVSVNVSLSLPGPPASALSAATRAYVDAAGIANAVITNGGAGSAFTGTLTPPITSLVPFALYSLQWTQASQGSDTVALNGLAAKTFKKSSGGALVNLAAGDVPASTITLVVFDGTNLQIIALAAIIPVPLASQARVQKTADQSVTSSTALVNDTLLFFPIAAGETWQFDMTLYTTMSTAGGLDVAVLVPPGSTVFYGVGGPSAAAITSGARVAAFLGGSGVANGIVDVFGVVANGVTPGTVTLQFSQDASNGTATTIKATSSLLAWRVKP